MRIAREEKSVDEKKTPSLPKAAGKETPSTSSKACAGFLGKQLKAKRADGSAYSCSYSPCLFKHVGKKGKSAKQLAKLVAEMPSPAREHLTAAMKKIV